MTQTMTAKLTGSARTQATAMKRDERLKATKVRVSARFDKVNDQFKKAEAALVKAKERLEKAKAKVEAVHTYGYALIEKQTTELEAAKKFHDVTLRREQERNNKPSKAKTPAGTVETEEGKVFPLPKSVIDTIKVVCKSKNGELAAGVDDLFVNAIAQVIEPDMLGDLFEVSINGRQKVILFTLENGKIRFDTLVATHERPYGKLIK